MNIPRFFIPRPIFATVVSLLILLLGGISYFQLPVSQYPDVVPPTIVVRATYPGATAETIAQVVATPLEQAINGVEGMLYMESSSTADGLMQITCTFEVGTDVEAARVKVQNRVTTAEPRLPEETRLIGVTTTESSPNLLMVVHMISPDDTRDQLYISNYVTRQVQDELERIDGVGSIQVFGGRLYSMRVWLDMERLAARELTAGDVLAALRGQNVQVASGTLGQPPYESALAFQLPVTTQGRLRTAEEFEEIIVKAVEGRVVRLADVARIELGAQSYDTTSYLDEQQAVAMVVTQRPGTNAIQTSDDVKATMDRLKATFPPGLDYRIVYNPTENVSDSIEEVFRTLLIAGLLVVLTVFLFLQSWRTALIPVAAIPVSLVGTYAVMFALGVDLNSLSLFGLVLAIGIVVDDAIVVVENVERRVSEGLAPREATFAAMDEVASALVATTAVLVAVFVPTAFIPGLSGLFYQQFALTIASATVISTIVSLTLSPALAAMLIRPKKRREGVLAKLGFVLFGWFFWAFNRFFGWLEAVYGRLVSGVLRVSALMLLVYVGLLAATGYVFQKTPSGFVPQQDQGYLIVAIDLPDGAALARTDEVVREVIRICNETPGITNAVGFAGFSGATFSNSSSKGAVFTALEDAAIRAEKGLPVEAVLANLQQRLAVIDAASLFALQPPPIQGIGNGAGFKMQIQDREGLGLDTLAATANQMAGAAFMDPDIAFALTNFSVGSPQVALDIDRTKVRMLDVPLEGVFEALQVYLGSVYVNDFNLLGRTYRVTAQADSEFRDERTDIPRLRTRSASGAIVPIGSVATLEERTAAERVVRFNLYPAADVQGEGLPGVPSSVSIDRMEQLAGQILPQGMTYAWTDLAFQQKAAGNTALLIFPLCVLLAFLVLAAQYESWLLPLAVILIVPLCILFALLGVGMRGMANDLLVQIGFVVLIGLAAKNAILIVEFASQLEKQGRTRREAAIEACRLRLRPVLMTSLSFILGTLPLLVATGAGFEMRQVLGTTVFSGMIGVTVLGLLLTPVFYVTLRALARKEQQA